MPNTLKLDSERREAPRYEVRDVHAELANEAFNASTILVDLSLNGALLEGDEPLKRDPGEAVSLRVLLEDERSFEASARIVHCTDCRIGLEFLAFDPVDFEILSELIAQLRRSRVASLLANPRG